ncbi:MAG: alpha/beta fold hydrolase [Solirubrobacterales bacterium]
MTIAAGGIAALAAAGAVGASALRARARSTHRRVLADPAHAALSAPLDGGWALEVESADGTRIHAEVFGPDDGPTVVLGHGWLEASHFWTHQIQELRRDHRVVAWDLRGHGRSAEPANRDYSIEALAGDLDAVLQAALPDGRRAVVAGHSLGGMTIVGWAGLDRITPADRGAAAALVNTGIDGLIAEALVIRTPGALERISDVVGRTVMAAPGRLPTRSTPITFEAIRYLTVGPDAGPATIAFCEEMILACGPEARAGCGATMSKLDLRDSVAGLDVPTLVIAGERDRLTPPVHSRRLVEALPDPIGYVELERIAHMGPVEAPERISDSLRGLVREHLIEAEEVAA